MIVRFLSLYFSLYLKKFLNICREENKKKYKLKISALYQPNSNHASLIYGLPKEVKDRVIGLAGQNGLCDLS